MAVPYSFAGTPSGTKIPLSELDANFTYVEGQLTVAAGNVLGTPSGSSTGVAQSVPMSNITAIAENSNTSRTLANRFGEVWNVKDYGAKGDGTTDDTNAIQYAINVANFSGGGGIFFPTGTYVVTHLYGKSNMAFYGECASKSIIKLNVGSTATLPLLYLDTVSNTSVEKLQFDLNAANANPNGQPAIAMTSTGNCVIRDCQFINFDKFGIQVNGTYFRVEDNYFKIYTPLTTANWGIWCCTIGPTKPCNNGILSGNYIDGSHLAVQGSQINIINNHITNFEYGGGIVAYYGSDCFDLTICNNICHSEHPSIDANVTVQSGMELRCYNSVISNNICYNNAANGIISSGRNCVISNNICYDNNLYKTVAPTFVGVGIATNVQYPSSIVDVSGTIIQGNICFNTLGPSGNQAYGYQEANSSYSYSSPVSIINNNFNLNAIAPVDIRTFSGRISYAAAPITARDSFGPLTLAAGASYKGTMTCANAVVGNVVTIAYSGDAIGVAITGYVQSANTVAYTMTNTTSGSVTLAAGTLTSIVVSSLNNV